MDPSFDHAVLLQQLLRTKKFVFAAIHGEAGEFPFDDTRKPDKCADIVEFDRPEAFLRVQNVKPASQNCLRAISRY